DAQGSWEKTPIDNEYIRVPEQSAVRVQDRMGRILAETECPALVGDVLVRGERFGQAEHGASPLEDAGHQARQLSAAFLVISAEVVAEVQLAVWAPANAVGTVR